jgi:hypothetical protein
VQIRGPFAPYKAANKAAALSPLFSVENMWVFASASLKSARIRYLDTEITFYSLNQLYITTTSGLTVELSLPLYESHEL